MIPSPGSYHPANGFTLLLPVSSFHPQFSSFFSIYNNSKLSQQALTQQLIASRNNSTQRDYSMSSSRFFSGGVDEARRRHFLDACFLCKKPIAKNVDIFMYRGDTPFCSKECRWEQMDMDEALERDRVVYGALNRQREKSTAAPMQRKPSLIAVPSSCDDKKRFTADVTAIFAGY
ncbi:hypothetical protein Cni_G27927 [Canna indica]|uniref:FLZ-type domain-containing protein n=1 Tax=Canna indica TaxID=4628 RepID=A0AAQ3L2V8_9LILI|nr:hypothetical protein Cni_G27927 [Canna indica]